MSKSYPIYNLINRKPSHAANADFGARDEFTQTVHVGTGTKNLHELACFSVERHESTHGAVTFSLFLDGQLIKRAHLVGKELQTFSIDQYVELGDAAADVALDAQRYSG